MTGEPATTRPMTDGAATSWTQRAEDRTGSSGSRLLAHLISPFVAVVPWLLMAGGAFLLARSFTAYRISFRMGWGELVAGVVLMLIAAAIWAALTAWSSVGTTIAGLCTLALGIFATGPGLRLVYSIGQEGPVTLQTNLYSVATPMTLVPLGSLLIAAGLGAAGARRLGRRGR